MQCNAMQCNAMQCNAMQCNAMQCNAMQYNTIQPYNNLHRMSCDIPHLMPHHMSHAMLLPPFTISVTLWVSFLGERRRGCYATLFSSTIVFIFTCYDF